MAKRPPMPQAAPVQRLLESILRNKGLDGKLREFRTWTIWDDAVGPQIARNARPLRIRDGVLEVRVAHPVWMQQLQMLKPQILKKVNERLEGAQIRDIYLRRGKVEQQPPEKDPSPAKKWQQIELTPEEQRQIEEDLKDLGDSELRRHLRQLFIRQRKLEKARQDG